MINGEVREGREREKDRQRKGRNNRSKERGEKIEKGEVVYRKEGKGEEERDKKIDIKTFKYKCQTKSLQ